MIASRRGFALLLVLAATLIVLAATSLSITLLLDTRRQVAATVTSDHHLDGLLASERLIGAWLASHGSRVVFPPEGGSISLVHERWRCEQGEGALTVELYDACAMIPARCCGLNGSLRAALPPSWSGVAMPDFAGERAEPPDWLETITVPTGLRRFPAGEHPRRAMDWSTLGTIAEPPAAAGPAAQDGLASIVSPHSQGAINLNTAPEPLLRTAFTQAGISGLQEIMQRRRRGLAISAVPEIASEAQHFRFVVASLAWHAHVQVRWNGVQRSWWVVVAGNSSEWRIVQRHDADR